MEDGFKSKGSGTEGATGPLDRDALCRLLSSISTLEYEQSSVKCNCCRSSIVVAEKEKESNRDEVVIIRFDRCRLRNSKMVEKRHRQKEEADLAEREYTAFSLILIQQEVRKRSSFRH
jgi:hypothetical protein